MEYFDYESMARKARISTDHLNALRGQIRQEFPQDDMMYELHLMRACMAIEEGHATIEEALRSEKAA